MYFHCFQSLLSVCVCVYVCVHLCLCASLCLSLCVNVHCEQKSFACSLSRVCEEYLCVLMTIYRSSECNYKCYLLQNRLLVCFVECWVCFLDHGGKWRDEYAVSLLKTGAESGSHVLKTTVILTSLREKMTYSMICNLFHIFCWEITRE